MILRKYKIDKIILDQLFIIFGSYSQTINIDRLI